MQLETRSNFTSYTPDFSSNRFGICNFTFWILDLALVYSELGEATAVMCSSLLLSCEVMCVTSESKTASLTDPSDSI